MATAHSKLKKHYGMEGKVSIKDAVFKELDENPLLRPKKLCIILGLKYCDYGNYVTKLRSLWKHYLKNERGSKCSLHGWRGWCFVPDGLARRVAVEQGWRVTRARNRWLLWKDRVGRLQWFETDRVNVYVRKPANLGKAYQLVCNGFSYTGLITDIKVLEGVLKSVKFKGAHYVFDVKQALPMLTIDLFSKSNGIVIKVGDRTHPTSVEVIAMFPDWGERVERLLEALLANMTKPGSPQLKNGGYIQ